MFHCAMTMFFHCRNCGVWRNRSSSALLSIWSPCWCVYNLVDQVVYGNYIHCLLSNQQDPRPHIGQRNWNCIQSKETFGNAKGIFLIDDDGRSFRVLGCPVKSDTIAN